MFRLARLTRLADSFFFFSKGGAWVRIGVVVAVHFGCLFSLLAKKGAARKIRWACS